VNTQDVAVRSSVPLALKFALTLADERTIVTVEGGGIAMLENVAYAHNDVDRELFSKLPTSTPGSGMSDAITLSSPGVVADSNGFFHPLGDHAQTSFSIDGQPIGDQQSKQFSTQIPLNAIQSMELITGAPGAEFGDKTSLVVNAVTRSGLGQKPFGSFAAQYGSFGSVGEEATLGLGGPRFGNFLSANSERSGRFLDTPEFRPFHDVGNSETIFDRLDWQPNGTDSFHLTCWPRATGSRCPTHSTSPIRTSARKFSPTISRRAISTPSAPAPCSPSTPSCVATRSTTTLRAIPSPTRRSRWPNTAVWPTTECAPISTTSTRSTI
jgi:outer membrane receptor protein involved in Fe transport